MERSWTFGQKVGAGYAGMVVLVLLTAALGVYALRSVSERKDRVIAVEARNQIRAEQLATEAEEKASIYRGYLLFPDAERLAAAEAARRNFAATLAAVVESAPDPESQRLLADIERIEAAHQVVSDELIAARTAAGAESTGRDFHERSSPLMRGLREKVKALGDHQQRLLERGSQDADAYADRAAIALGAGLAFAVLLAIVLSTWLARTLSRQIGSAVQQVQSSSTELQTAANQQASGAKEQSTAMNEITTTISELLATSRQIAESAQRVSQIAGDTAKAARASDQTVGKAGESVGAIKRQVDLIVTHMLDLGKKSQQIGGILEIINELAEQTNILAINATIEAAGAGDAGRRFGVVADEIRKLADRVGGSTKEIRTLIEDIRGAVNATVMTTETGTKAVDAGTRQFAEVATALAQIVSSVGTTTEAAREIELSTKQQATAVEQVNMAVSNVAQATKETEASATQTLQTATQLTALSRDLMRLIEPQAGT